MDTNTRVVPSGFTIKTGLSLPRATVFLGVCLATILVAVAPSRASAQAKPTAARAYGISAFAAGGLATTDYGSRGGTITAGADFTFYPSFLHLFAPSIEGRYTYSHGSAVSESSFQAGLQVGRSFGKFRPYCDLLVGYAVINFNAPNPTYTYDDAVVLTPGAGLDYDLFGPFALKADFQGQFWTKIGKGYTGLTPKFYTVGVTYTFPAKAFRSER